MDYVDIPRLNDIPIAAITTISDDNIIRFACSNLTKYIFKFNKLNELEYCIYRYTDMQETSDTEEIPDFKKALEMATYKVTHIMIPARGK